MLNNDNSNGNNAAAAEDNNHGHSDEESELKRRFCKICYITSEDELQDGTGAGKDDDWVHPCKCKLPLMLSLAFSFIIIRFWHDQVGSPPMPSNLAWTSALSTAVSVHHVQVILCKIFRFNLIFRYNYRSSWQLKPLSRWTWPSLKLNFWDGIEICMDFACTYFMLKRINQLIQVFEKSLFLTTKVFREPQSQSTAHISGSSCIAFWLLLLFLSKNI